MTHRTIDLSGIVIEVFDTSLGASSWIKKQVGDCIVVVRGKSYFQRKDQAEMTVRLNATDNPQNRHIVAAANSVADEIEREIEKQAVAA